MKRLSIGIILSVFLLGCGQSAAPKVTGVWQTEPIDSEWGTNIITLTLSPDGSAVQQNHFVEENERITLVGVHSVQGDLLVCTFRDPDGHSTFDVTSKIKELTQSALTIAMDDEVYRFTRKD